MNIIGGLQEAQFRAAQEIKELRLQLNEKKAFDDHTSEVRMQLLEETVELRTMAMQSNEENAALRAAVAKLQHPSVSLPADWAKAPPLSRIPRPQIDQRTLETSTTRGSEEA